MRIRVGTLNCRNTTDRWRERADLLVAQMAELHPDVMGLQELRHFPDQAGWIADRTASRTGSGYTVHRTYKTGVWWWWEGIAIISRLPVLERESLRLGHQHRVANFARVQLPDAGTVDFYNTHLASDDEGARASQAGRIVDWMAARPGTPQLLVGDFNARPRTPTVELLRRHGLRSAYAVVHGEEPPRTVPTPLRRGRFTGSVIDYLFVNDLVDVSEAWVTFDRTDARDPHLAASDHYGLAATISVRAGGHGERSGR